MRQRIHAGARGDGGRHAHGQLGIADGDLRHHQRMEDHLLGVGRLIGDDAGAADLEPVPAVVGTATTGRIPLGSARVHQSPTSSKSHIGLRCPAMKAMTLPASSAEPPPKAMTPVVPAGPQRLQIGLDVRPQLGRVDVAEQARLHAGRGQPGQRIPDHRHGRQPRVGDEQRPRHARNLRCLASSLIRPAPKRIAVG